MRISSWFEIPYVKAICAPPYRAVWVLQAKSAAWINRDGEKESKTPLLASLTVEHELISLIPNPFKSGGFEKQKM